jgi:2-polyprenyl-3-methyl-5-hydroxy-6-metoxy-1,4-benzoquinol methylase
LSEDQELKTHPETGQWTSAAIQEMAMGHFMAARVLRVAATLDIFSHLAVSCITAQELAGRLGVNPQGLEALLIACTALQFLEKEGEGYRTQVSSAAFLAAGSSQNLIAFVAGTSGVYQDWVKLEAAIRKGEATAMPNRARGAGELRAFVLKMHRSALAVAHEVAEVVDMSKAKRLLDIGSGAGTFAAVFCRRNPRLQATLLDLPEVIEVARSLPEQSDLSPRVQTREADYHHDALPPGYDVALLCNVLHQEHEEAAQQLLRKAYGTLRQQGMLVVLDAVLDDDKAGPLHVALGSLNQYLHHKGGGYHSAKELSEWLRRAGFAAVERKKLSFANQALLLAHKSTT